MHFDKNVLAETTNNYYMQKFLLLYSKAISNLSQLVLIFSLVAAPKFLFKITYAVWVTTKCFLF